MKGPAAELQQGRRGSPQRILWGRAVSWALYDFANTIYSALVVSYAIALHVKGFTGVEKYTFITMAASLVLSGLLLPFAGEASDRTGRPKRYLVVLTVLACASCAAISAAGTAWLILAFFFVANFCYNFSLTFYDSLLPTLAPREKLGAVSGMGVGLGYAGTAFAIPIGFFVVARYGQAYGEHQLRPVFATAAALFLLFSLPLLLFVPEKRATKRTRRGTGILRLASKRVLVTLRALPRHRPLMLFLLGNFLCVDALNTGIVAYAPYLVNVFGLDASQTLLWMLPFSLAAGLLAVVGGLLSDRFGPRRTMISAGICVLAALLIGGTSRSFPIFIVSFILLGGYGLSTIWVAGRKLLVELAPPGQIGKYFGLYNVGHKLSIIGPVAFGVVADLRIPGIEAGGYRLGLLLQTVLLSMGLVCIYKVRPADGSSP